MSRRPQDASAPPASGRWEVGHHPGAAAAGTEYVEAATEPGSTVAQAPQTGSGGRIRRADSVVGHLDPQLTGFLHQLDANHGAPSELEGHTILIVTHDPEVGDACDRTIRMGDGCIVAGSGSSAAGRRA